MYYLKKTGDIIKITFTCLMYMGLIESSMHAVNMYMDKLLHGFHIQTTVKIPVQSIRSPNFDRVSQNH